MRTPKEQSQEKRTTRKSPRSLRQTTISIESLRGSKHRLNQEPLVDIDVKRKRSTKDKDTQVNFTETISVDDLTNPAGASENYWKILAEKRQVTIKEAFDENLKLHAIVDELKKELADHKQMLDEANNFVEVIKEELNCNNDDTGIDLNDVSTSDDATEDPSTKDD